MAEEGDFNLVKLFVLGVELVWESFGLGVEFSRFDNSGDFDNFCILTSFLKSKNKDYLNVLGIVSYFLIMQNLPLVTYFRRKWSLLCKIFL